MKTAMDKSAIERIEQLALGATTKPDTYIPSVILPGGMTVHSLEEFQDQPARFRQSFSTRDLTAFCDYVKLHATDDSCIYVHEEASKAIAIIDHGSQVDPEWGVHRASFETRPTPEFKALTDACANAMTQRQLTDFLEDWPALLIPARADEAADQMSLVRALSAIRKVDIKAIAQTTHEESNFRAAKSGFESIEAQNSEGGLPIGFNAACSLYHNTTARPLFLRLAIRTGSDKPMFTLRIQELERIKKDVADEIQQTILEKVAGTKVFIGSVQR
jgi:uncharacterized protein YfdQ (DUF2303 family)